MCGIVGYLGHNEAVPVLINGLKRLEYRGYDSAGIAVLNNSNIEIVKEVGKISNLESVLAAGAPKGTIGIGHTRWATHGPKTDINSHPHESCDGQFVLVHNGIIENYKDYRNMIKDGTTITYHPNGSINKASFYVEGYLVSFVELFDRDGCLMIVEFLMLWLLE